MGDLWNTILLEPLVNGLIFLYGLTGNLGLAIILFTVLIRLVLTPFALPAMRTAQKMKELAPHLARLKQRHKDDKAKLTQAQMDLYKEHGVNPAAGCLPQIAQLVILIALFQAFNKVFIENGDIAVRLNELLWPVLQLPSDFQLNTKFLYLSLTQPDILRLPSLPVPIPGLFIIFAALAQFLSSAMMGPALGRQKKEAEKTPGGMDDFSTSMQQSMLWIFPLTTLIIGVTFPSGLVVYWGTLSVFQLVQQYMVSGWGGLTPWVNKFLKNNNE